MDTPFKIYNASAGSGKTYTLTKEYLKIVLSTKSSFQKILAITFTNKAVNEMKERILGSLFDFSINTGSAMFLEISKELGLDKTALRKRAKTTLKELLHNYAFFDISTIDKFTHRLIRTFAKDLKLPQNFEVILDTDLLLDEAVYKLIDKAGQDKKLTRVLIAFALAKIDDDKSWDIGIDLNKIGKLLFNEANTPHLKKLSDKKIDDFLELQGQIFALISAAERAAQTIAEQALALIQHAGLLTTDFPRATLPNHFKKIIDGAFETTKLYSNTLEAQLSSGKILKAGIQLPSSELPLQILTKYLEIKQKINERALLKNTYTNIVPLTVLNAIKKEVKQIELDRDQLSISEFNAIIANEIKDQPAPFIYERLGEKYTHYFIDEFQDTSEMQWNNLIPLIDNALSIENGSLFLVGDAKQAIYRWRGGKAEQFLNLVTLKTNPFVIPPEVTSLPKNFRSHEEITKFNNAFFTATHPLLGNESYRTLFKEGNNQEYNTKKGGLVQITFLDPDAEDSLESAYCNEVLQIIMAVRAKNYGYNDICLLVRGNKEGVLLADFLTQQQIPIISSESLLLKGSSKVRFLIDLLKLQDQPQDKELAYVVLSYISKAGENRHQFIEEHLNDPIRLLKSSYGYDMEKLKTLSVFDGLEQAIRQFDLASNSDGYITYLMDVVLEVEQKEGIGIPIFLSYWEKKKDRLSIAAPTAINAVQIMTVHKAKGLEFEVVIFPFANSNIYKEIEPKIWLPVEADKFNGFDEVLISKKQEVVKYGAVAEKLYLEEQQKLELDAFNVLYVALTRAVKALYVITKRDLTKSGEHKPDYYSGLFIHFLKERQLWSELTNSYSFGKLETNASTEILASAETIPYQYSHKDRPSFKILTKSGMLWDTKREDALSKGNLIHFIMGLIETKNDVEKAMDSILRSGDLALQEVELLKNKIQAIVAHPKLVPYYKEGIEVQNERDIITENGTILRPDRIVIDGAKATVIDYKTGKRDQAYKEQVYSYADALETMGYTIENKIIIYINTSINAEFI